MAVHDLAGRGFGAAAEVYERARPGYPEAAVSRLVDVVGIGPGAAVVDLAAGTGKLTRQLVPFGARLVAVEPVEAMCRQLARSVPDVEVLRGVAEALPLRAATADAVTVAQAFHWFGVAEAAAEIRRVLRPGGRLALIWNRRDEGHDSWARLSRPLEPHMDGLPRYRSSRWRQAFDGTALFGPLRLQVFTHAVETGVDDEVALAASTSAVAALPDDEREQVLDEVRRALDGQPSRFSVPWFTDLYWCRAH